MAHPLAIPFAQVIQKTKDVRKEFERKRKEELVKDLEKKGAVVKPPPPPAAGANSGSGSQPKSPPKPAPKSPLKPPPKLVVGLIKYLEDALIL